MSDISRQSSPRLAPVYASPNRPSPLSRPHWPYSTYSHRSTSSSTSMHSNSSSTLGPQALDSRSSSMSSPNTVQHSLASSYRRPPSMFGAIPNAPEENIRHWSFNALEWIVRDVHKLRDYVEDQEAASAPTSAESTSPSASDFEVLKESPTLGDGKYKLEIAKMAIDDPSEPSTPPVRTQPPRLSLYITSVMLEYAHADYEIYTSMFAAIKCQDDRVGERGARADWAWETWQNEWVFREDSEVWECPLPPLSQLLENPRTKETDSFVICVQIHSPVGPFFPQQPSASYVPKDLLDGLEASLDNMNTGDIQFVCLERRHGQQSFEDQLASPNTETSMSRSSTSISHTTMARKRIIYAHSDILTRRSEYFSTMLNSAFSESAAGSRAPGERKMYTVVVEEADFITIYWLLKWVYANWLLFMEQDDPKIAVEGIGAGWSVKSLGTSNSADEWDWKPLSRTPEASQDGISETRSVVSVDSTHSSGERNRIPGGKGKQKWSGGSSSSQTTPAVRTPSGRARTLSTPKGPISPSQPPPSPSRRPSAVMPPVSPNATTLAVPLSATKSPSVTRTAKSVPVPISTSSANFSTPPHYPLSPQQQRRPRPAADPHPHPTPPPPPASALSMYQVAHRYSMPGLAALALEHMMSTINPQSSFALLLATSTWDELHVLVEDYVVEKWEEVSVSPEFEQCCQEVAGGEWGPEGGKTMMALFRRLRSPYIRT